MSSRKAQVWIYGVNAVGAIVETCPETIVKLCAAGRPNNPRLSRLHKQALKAGVACSFVAGQAVDRLVGNGVHQGVAALCVLPECLGEQDLKPLCAPPGADELLFLILDCVTDPVNLGACLRSAEVFGATAVVVPSDKSARLTPAAVKAASGAVGRVPIVRASNLARAITLLKKEGVWIVGAWAQAEQPLHKIDCRRPVAFVLGAEGAGLRRRTAGLCDHFAAIPVRGRVESLNVSAAAATCLYEAGRQRGQETGCG